jgi:hypothetical protein
MVYNKCTIQCRGRGGAELSKNKNPGLDNGDDETTNSYLTNVTFRKSCLLPCSLN